jgi:hypothetical protein
VRIECTGIARARRRTAAVVGQLSGGVAIGATLLAPLLRTQGLSPVLALSILGAPLGSLLAWAIYARRHYVAGSLELNDQALTVRRGDVVTTYPRGEITGALVRDRVIEIGLRSGDVIVAETLPESAEGFVAEFEQRGLQRRRSIRSEHATMAWRPLSTFAALYFALLYFGAALFMLQLTDRMAKVGVWAACVIATWILTHYFASKGIVLGADGMTISRPFSAQFVAWERVKRAYWSVGTFIVELRDGDPLVFNTMAIDTARLIEAELAQRTRQGDSSLSALDRAGRSLDEWKAALHQLTDDEGDAAYRGINIPRAALEEVVVDANAPVERRLGAAIALRAKGEEHAERIRVAAEASANEHLRIAFDKIAEGDVELSTIEDASRAADE